MSEGEKRGLLSKLFGSKPGGQQGADYSILTEEQKKYLLEEKPEKIPDYLKNVKTTSSPDGYVASASDAGTLGETADHPSYAWAKHVAAQRRQQTKDED